MTPYKVVVGYDTSEESINAVRWAAIVAERRKAPLAVVAATGWLKPPAELAGLVSTGETLAQRVAEEGVKVAKETAPGLEVDAVGVQNTAAAALLHHSMEAQLVVVGHRGAGALRLGQIGSVAFSIVNHASCPVVVIRGEATELPSDSLPSVVAVDGSKASDIALEQAAQWADESGTALRILSVWRTPMVHPWSSISIDDDNKVNREASVRAEEAAVEIAERAKERAQLSYPDLVVETVVTQGRPAEAIVDESKDASLVIVGARGRGDFASLILGSVSREVIEHASRPVYVVR